MEHLLTSQVFSCNKGISPIEGALSLSQSFVTVLSGPSEILQGECRSRPAPDRYCTEDETPDAYTCKNTESLGIPSYKRKTKVPYTKYRRKIQTSKKMCE